MNFEGTVAARKVAPRTPIGLRPHEASFGWATVFCRILRAWSATKPQMNRAI